MYKAAIFDLDGTIADTIESIAVSSNEVLKLCGLQPRPVEEYNYYAGDGADTLIRRALAAAGDKKGINFEMAYTKYQEIFEKDCTFKVKIFDGMKETLDYMKSLGMKLAVVTNKPHLRAITVVETLYGQGYFEFIIGQQSGIKKKPDPEGTLLAASKLGVKPLECIYVGDTNVDMQTGNAAGMFTIGVLWGFRERQELIDNKAHALAESPKELIDLVLK